MTQSPGNSSAPILTFGPIPMTHTAKKPPDALLPQIYCAISPLTETGEEAECLNFRIKADGLAGRGKEITLTTSQAEQK